MTDHDHNRHPPGSRVLLSRTRGEYMRKRSQNHTLDAASNDLKRCKERAAWIVTDLRTAFHCFPTYDNCGFSVPVHEEDFSLPTTWDTFGDILRATRLALRYEVLFLHY